MARVYLDYNATSVPRVSAKEAVAAAMMAPANASSVHTEGRAARAIVEDARHQLAVLIGAEPECIFFTSGATESNATALSPQLELAGEKVRCDVLVLSGVEHPSVRAGGSFGEDAAIYIPVDRNGVVDVGALEGVLQGHRAQKRRAFVSVMAANNETGFLTGPFDDAAYREAVAALLDDRELRRTMGERAERRIRERHDLEKNYALVEDRLAVLTGRAG